MRNSRKVNHPSQRSVISPDKAKVGERREINHNIIMARKSSNKRKMARRMTRRRLNTSTIAFFAIRTIR